MKQNRPIKRRKKERTWAEAATVVLERSNGRSLGIREIQQKIFDYKLKDIKMNKLAENVLKTMLSHHANMNTCPFYKVKERSGYYALKKDYQKYMHDDASSDKDVGNINIEDLDEDSREPPNSTNRPSTRGKGFEALMLPTSSKFKNETRQKKLNPMTRRSNSYTGSMMKKQLLSRRRTSSPMLASFRHTKLRKRASDNIMQRRDFIQRSLNSDTNGNILRSLPMLDLETPNSVLTNTRLKSVINTATFSMLPASYQYKLAQLLPKADLVIDNNGIPRITPTALNNEFISQAIQDWATQLSEGEFTRETQARIMQEIAKERSKINPWKEQFFEEFYGQKIEVKRSRSRSYDATSNLADLSFEAQVAKFQHLRDELHLCQSEVEEDNDEIVEVEDQDSEKCDPDYTITRESQKLGVRRTFPPGLENLKEPPKDTSAKPLNRRKINKPFKRNIYNSLEQHIQGTALMHRKAMVQHRNVLNYNQYNQVDESIRHEGILENRPAFQIRDEFYHSDSEISDSGELSDSNSFHQHDDTDEEGEFSDDDEMMNLGDDNLLDVDENSESDDFEGIDGSLHTDAVAAEHSYTRLPRKTSDEKNWRRSRQLLGSVMPMMSREEARMGQPNTNTTLVLRPRGNLGQTVQAMSYNEDSSSTSPEQPSKKHCVTQSMFGKILTVSKAETSREERVGVLFSRGVQLSPHRYNGDAIVPRISMTSSLITSPVSPTTVCTTTSVTKNDVGNKDVLSPIIHHSNLSLSSPISNRNTTVCGMSPGDNPTNSKVDMTDVTTRTSITPDTVTVPKTVKSTSNITENTEETANNLKVMVSATLNTDSKVAEPKNSKCYTEILVEKKTSVTAGKEMYSTPANPHMTPAKVSAVDGSTPPDPTVGSNNVVEAPSQPKALASKYEERIQHRETSPVLTSRVKQKSASILQSKPLNTKPANSPPVLSNQHSTLPVKKPPASSSSPLKRTRTLAEIKAQMKAKRLAAATTQANSNVQPTATVTRSATKLIQSNALPNTFNKHKPLIEGVDLEQKPSSPVLTSGESLELRNKISPDNSSSSTDISSNYPVTERNDSKVFPSKQEKSSESSPKTAGKIILKIKSEEGKKYTVKVKRTNSPIKSSGTESDDMDDVIIRKSRRLSHMISSSDDSSDNTNAVTNNSADLIRFKEQSRLSQLLVPVSYTGKVVSVMDHHLLMKKSPVFGEPAFEAISPTAGKSVPIHPQLSLDNCHPDNTSESKMQPFMSDKPVIGFQDIQSSTSMSSSNAPTFLSPATVIKSTQDAQKYRSTSKGKSLVEMQKLARTVQNQSDESEIAESDTEDDENDSMVSTTSEDEEPVNGPLAMSIKLPPGKELRKTNERRENGLYGQINSLNQNNFGSDCEEAYSSSSNDDHPIITDCICACKRLVLCKGCGAYTHEECLSSASLCSLCV